MTDEQISRLIASLQTSLMEQRKGGQLSEEGYQTLCGIMKDEISRADDEGGFTDPKPLGYATYEGANDAALAHRVRTLTDARARVSHLLGEREVLAFDSASALYGAGLRKLGVTTAGVHPDAFEAIFLGKMRDVRPAPQRDTKGFDRRHPNVSRIQAL